MIRLDAFEIARNNADKCDPVVTRYFHASVILSAKGKIISAGKNHWAGRIIIADDDNDKYIKKTVHSEVDALSKVNIRRLDGAVIINYSRTNVASNLSKPCDNCWAILKKLGFKKVFYSVRSDINKPTWREEYFD